MTDAVNRPRHAYTVEDLTASLADRIAAGEYPLGSWMRQVKVAQDYGVSRTPASLALSRLEAMGIVQRVPNRGFRVRYPSPREVVEAFDVRAALEGHAAYRAARHATESQLEQLSAHIAGLRHAIEMIRDRADVEAASASWQQSHNAFHHTIFDAADNSQLHAAADALYHKVPRKVSWQALRGDPRALTLHADELDHITTAVKKGDAPKARELTIAHIETAREVILAHLPNPNDDLTPNIERRD
ncbi:GntR family transcriptional regulator [Mycolicibacterium sp.]|uniref:GntR family transcriptional regulator n=1 Tax=Mycolicibacterium sp. TaxID=2320850 RepID=UPI00093E0219|nr:hypothetical protein EB73_00005 [Mycobacterium sp. SWH-M3]